MPRITVKSFTGEVIKTHLFPAGRTFAGEAMSLWPKGLGPNPPDIIEAATGRPLTPEDAVHKPLAAGDEVFVVIRPGEPVTTFLAATAFLGVSWGQVLLTAISLIATAAMASKIANTGSYEWEEPEAPQRLSGQTNEFRPNQRVPDIFGAIRHYPDLIAPAVLENVGTDARLEELYVITAGAALINDLKLDEEGVSELPSGSWAVYGPDRDPPFDTWPADFPLLKTNAFVGEIGLAAPNSDPIGSSPWQFKADGTIVVDVDQYWDGFGFVGSYFMPTDGPSADNIRPFEIVAKSADGRTLTVDPAPTTEEDVVVNAIRIIESMAGTPANPTIHAANFQFFANTQHDDATGGWYISAVDPRPTGTYTRLVRISDLKETPVNWVNQWTGSTQVRGFTPGWSSNPQPPQANGDSWMMTWQDEGSYNPGTPAGGFASGIMNVPGISTEIWLDFAFPRGLYQQVSGQAPKPRNVKVRVFYREEGTTPWTSVDFEFSDATRNSLRFTRKILGLTPAKYECYCERVTDSNLETGSSVTVDTVQWVRLQGRQDAPDLVGSPLVFTMVRLNVTSASLATFTQNRRFNCFVSRRLPDHWNNNPNFLIETQRIRDAILYTLINQANYTRDEIDFAGLGEVHDQLVAIAPQAAFFNGSIDQTMTSDDQLLALGEVGRISMYRRGQRIYFNRVGRDSTPVTLFNARNKAAPETKTLVYSETSDPDGILIRFRDANDNYVERTIQYPILGTPVQPTEITLLGVTDPAIAYRRAKYEWDKQRLQRDAVTCEVFEEGLLLDPADVFAMSDAFLTEKPVEGEVVSVSGTNYTFDQVIPAGNYMARLRDQYGTLVASEEVTFAADGQTQAIPAWGSVAEPAEGSQVGLLFTMTPIGDASGQLWVTAQFAPAADDTGVLEGVRYNPDVYDADNPALEIPALVFAKRRPDDGD